MAGITWAKFAQVPDSFCWILIIILSTRIVIGLRRPLSPFGKYLILPLFFLIGGVHTTPFLQPPKNLQHIYHQLESRQEAVVTGTLLKAPEIGPEKSRLLLEAEHLQFKDHDVLVSGKIRLSMPGEPPPHITPGDKVMVRAKLSRPRSYGVPGAFDYRTFLTYQSIWADGWIYSPYLINKVQEIPSPRFHHNLPFLAEQIRQKIGLFLRRTLPATTSGIYRAILTGDRSGVFPAIIENYKATGTIHLLAISGMHMALLSLSLGFAVTWCLKRSERLLLKWPVMKSAAVISMLPLAFYALIAGLNIPVFRALIMAYIFIGALLFNRQQSIANNIAIAALILLAINPVELFTISFQLSFAAVSSIALIYPKLSGWLNLRGDILDKTTKLPGLSKFEKIYKFALAGLALSVAASIGTAPLLAFYFNRISLISSVSTLLVEPFLCLWSLVLGLIGCLFLPFQTISGIVFQIGSWGITAANFITELLARLPHASIWLTTPTYPSIILYYVLIIGIFSALPTPQWAFNKKQDNRETKYNPASKLGITGIIFAVIVSSLVLHFRKDIQKSRHTSVSILDVGQGLATVIELPSGKTFVIDGGKKMASKTSSFNVGQNLIAPFLWKKGISRLDGIIISHPHSDHYNGLAFLIEHFQPATIWSNKGNSYNSSQGEYGQLLELANLMGVSILTPSRNQLLHQEDDIYIQSISDLHSINIDQPKGSASRKKDAIDNNKSLVIKLTVGNRDILFPGDIEKEAEKTLIIEEADIRADVLVAPHHGSITSSTTDFINKVAAQQVVISAGVNQWGKFPSLEVLEKYHKAGYGIKTTGKSGTIFVETNGDELEIRTFYKENIYSL